MALLVAGCSGSPTAPSGPSQAVKSDPRFDAAFFSSFVQHDPPKSLVIYISDEDNKKQPVPPATIEAARDAAATLQAALGLPVDVRPVRGSKAGDIIRGITVSFAYTAPDSAVGGYATFLLPGVATINYMAVTYDVCGGLAKTVVRHELMHAMGFGHTDSETELMYPQLRYCDRLPSPREQFHGRVALGMAP
jgi:hypothetical protein